MGISTELLFTLVIVTATPPLWLIFDKGWNILYKETNVNETIK